MKILTHAERNQLAKDLLHHLGNITPTDEHCEHDFQMLQEGIITLGELSEEQMKGYYNEQEPNEKTGED